VSTLKQAEKGISIEDQIRRGKEFCKEHNYDFEIFSDEGYSGDLPIDDRPALTKLFEKLFLKQKEINGIFVVDFDRLTRNEKEAKSNKIAPFVTFPHHFLRNQKKGLDVGWGFMELILR
jgi:DNA invertase Pin-like site-specific DNA recombinase